MNFNSIEFIKINRTFLWIILVSNYIIAQDWETPII